MREREIATKDDWEIFPMPESHESFVIKRKFSDKEIENLKYGHIPQEMEDRWFAYYENDELHIHRSWSGNCIYIVKFNFRKGKHEVIVNRDMDQYACTDIKEDEEEISDMLKWLSY